MQPRKYVFNLLLLMSVGFFSVDSCFAGVSIKPNTGVQPGYNAALPPAPNVTFANVKPNGPQGLTLNQNANISWNYSGQQISPDLPVRVELLQDTVVYGVITNSIKISIGSFPWRVGYFNGGKAKPGGNYAIRVCTLDGKKCGKSSTPFYINPSLPLEVKGPTEPMMMGQNVNILWSFDMDVFPDPANQKVKLMLWKGNVGKTIADNVPLTPSYFKWKAGEWKHDGDQGYVESGEYQIGIHAKSGDYSHKGPLLRIKGKQVSAQTSAAGIQAAAEAMNAIEVRHPQNGAACQLNDKCALLWKRNTVKTSKVKIELWQGDQMKTYWGNVSNTGKHVWEIGKGQTSLVGDNYYYIITSSDEKQKGKSGTFRIDHFSAMHTLGFRPKVATTFSIATYRHKEDINADAGVCQNWSGHKPMIVQRLWWDANNDNFGGCCNYGWAYFDVKPNAVPVNQIRKATLTFRNHFLSSAFTGTDCTPQEVGDWMVIALSGMRDWNAPGDVLAHPQTEQVSLDVTQLVKKWITGERQNFGFLFRPVAPVRWTVDGCLIRNNDHIRYAIENPELKIEYEEHY